MLPNRNETLPYNRRSSQKVIWRTWPLLGSRQNLSATAAKLATTRNAQLIVDSISHWARVSLIHLAPRVYGQVRVSWAFRAKKQLPSTHSTQRTCLIHWQTKWHPLSGTMRSLSPSATLPQLVTTTPPRRKISGRTSSRRTCRHWTRSRRRKSRCLIRYQSVSDRIDPASSTSRRIWRRDWRRRLRVEKMPERPGSKWMNTVRIKSKRCSLSDGQSWFATSGGMA